jgi:transitional endoplasmic reticulum ATPase
MRPGDLKRMGLIPPAGILLWGPLGAGLAMLPEACATEAGVSYVYVSGREILGKPEAIVETLREAGREAPAVLYISDLDWLAPQAGANAGAGEGQRGKPPAFAGRELTDVFLRELDRLQAAAARLAIIGGTYRIDVVDQALIRDKSRFNRKVFLPPPDAAARRAVLLIYAGRTPNDGRLDLDAIAASTEGYVGWDLENVVKKAALRAIEAGRTAITQEDLVAAVPRQGWLTRMVEGTGIFAADAPIITSEQTPGGDQPLRLLVGRVDRLRPVARVSRACADEVEGPFFGIDAEGQAARHCLTQICPCESTSRLRCRPSPEPRRPFFRRKR